MRLVPSLHALPPLGVKTHLTALQMRPCLGLCRLLPSRPREPTGHAHPKAHPRLLRRPGNFPRRDCLRRANVQCRDWLERRKMEDLVRRSGDGSPGQPWSYFRFVQGIT